MTDWNNKEEVLEAVKDGWTLKHASEELRGDKEVVLAAVKKYVWSFEDASEELRADREVVLAAVKKYGGILKYASDELRGDKEVALIAVKQNGYAIKYVSEELKNDPEFIKEVAVSVTDWNNQKKMAIGIGTLAHANEELRDDKEVVLAAVKRSGYELEYASEELRNDKEIFDTAKESLMEVVKRSGYALEYVSEELKNDKEMVLAAVGEDGSAIKYASEELKNDPEFMKEVEQVLESTQDESTQEKLEPQPLMKYQIKDIKEGVEFVIDDDQTFDELIEFYLPFRLSELSSLDPSKPGDYDFNLIEAFFRGGKSPEIEDWADKVVDPVNCDHAIRLYVALATYADKNKADRVLALDIIYCLIGLNNQSWIDLMEAHFEESHLSIANQIVIEWGNHEVAKFLVEETLEHPSLTNLELDIKPQFFGILSDLFGADLYFDAAKAYLEEENYHVDESNYLVGFIQLSLEYLDNDNWAREIYKNYLEKQRDSIANDIEENGIESWGVYNIIPIAESIAKDLNDKKWEGEIYKDLLSKISDDEIKEIKDTFAYLF